jgi:hypothetical protein
LKSALPWWRDIKVTNLGHTHSAHLFLYIHTKMASLLTGSEVFMLIMAGISFLGACVGITYSFILRSRCTQISCCGASCTRDVLPADQSQLDTTAMQQVTARLAR